MTLHFNNQNGIEELMQVDERFIPIYKQLLMSTELSQQILMFFVGFVNR